MEKDCPRCKGTGKIQVSLMAALVGEKGVEQSEIAALLGITQSQVSRLLRMGDNWWRGLNNRTYHNLDAFAARLGVTRHQLTGHEPIRAPRATRPIRKPSRAKIAASRRRRAVVAGKNRKR